MSPRKVVPKKSPKKSPQKVSQKAVPKKRGAAKYKLPDPIPKGEILTDLRNNKWVIGSAIGKGGFGAIYSASEASTAKEKDLYAIKIEPKENGPLFVEMHFMMRVCQPDDIAKWRKEKNLAHVGIPRFVASGSHTCNERTYRFVVMDKYGKDLWSIFLEHNKVFALSTVVQIGMQVLDVLEYIHRRGYVHADIKGSNLVMGLKKGTEIYVYLIDFGLVSKYTTREYKCDPKYAHNGTIEYASRDAHDGVATRRGDLEVLGYNMLQWLTSRLPWEDKIPNNALVQKEKIKYMEDIPQLLKCCFGKETPSPIMSKYFNYVAGLAHDEEPDYDFCRDILREGLKAMASDKVPAAKKVEKESPEPKKRVAQGKKVANDIENPPKEDGRPKRVSPKRPASASTKPVVRKRQKK